RRHAAEQGRGFRLGGLDARKRDSRDMIAPPQNPAGPYVPEVGYGPERRAELVAVIGEAPAKLRELIGGLGDEQLDVPYRNWTIRQIVHHLADSHVNSYVRFKWALTEDRPTI